MDEVDFKLFNVVNLSRRGTAERSNGTRVPSGDSSEDPAKAVIGRFLPNITLGALKAPCLNTFVFAPSRLVPANESLAAALLVLEMLQNK